MALTQLREWLLAPYCKDGSNVTPPLHRKMLVVSGGNAFCNAALCSIHSLTDDVSSISIASFTGNTLKGKKRKQVLGSEYDMAILDCRDTFKPGDMMAVAGTVKRKGCLVIVCPNFSEWVENVSVPFISEGFTLSRSRYLARFIERLRNSAYVAFHTETKTILPDIERYRVEQISKQHAFESALFKTQEQQDAYERLYQAFSVNQLNALVTAPRGRGKSSLLGIFIDSLISEGKNVLLTSEQVSNVTNLMSRINKHKGSMPSSLSSSYGSSDDKDQMPVNHKITPLGSVKWVPPDSELLYGSCPSSGCNNNTRFDLVVVDEAASLPLPVVARILAHNPQWVLSTTLQGYEGSGNGFIHKLIPNLPNTVEHLSLSTPLRWFDKDPVERFLNHTCLFEEYSEKDTPCLSPPENRTNNIAHIEQEDSALLMKVCSFNICSFENIAEHMLQQVMSLLALAHYQTTPDDFMRLLDSPDVLVATLKTERLVLAAAIINIEGGNSLGALSCEIASGRRRPQGHLGAQRLTLLSADPEAATFNYWRINRIAVQPKLQARGVGSYLIQKLIETTHGQAIDAMCTSYGTTAKLDKFWSNNGFQIVDYGRRPNKASGETSALAILPKTSNAKAMVARLIALKTSLNSAAMLNELPHSVLSTYVNKLVHFTQGTRPLDDVWPILNKLACEIQTKSNMNEHKSRLNSEGQKYDSLALERAELLALLNKLVSIIESKGYLKALFTSSDREIGCIKALLINHNIKVNGLKELTSLIRTTVHPAFDSINRFI
jgi:tRNA(Met) cytidine acetyltransferase